ncbi:MAG TPA: hypothetical protein VG318_17790 [Actinomycetota bacterium]|nr:hypothetical protein [Actinomycetota bacterium]
MGRIGPVVAAVAVAALAGTSVWAVAERRDLGGRVERLEDALDSAQQRIEASAAARRAVAEAAAATTRRAKRTSRLLNTVEGRLYGARVDADRLSAVAGALEREGRKVFETRLLRGGSDDLLVVQWHESIDGATRTGLDVWRVGEPRWDLVYVAEPHPSFDPDRASYVLYGHPDAPVQEELDFVQRIDVFDTGDANGDGLDDLAVWEAGQGSGGCGHVKLLANTGDTLRETYRHEGCNHGLEIRRGHLVLGEAWHPRGCAHIHGCGHRGTWMRWTGASWEVVDVRRERY